MAVHSSGQKRGAPEHNARRGSELLEYQTLRDQIRDALRERIGDGLVAPGERLVEQSLADEFGVSRGPVREALKGLEAEGLVTITARHGTVVAELTESDVELIFEVRIALEVLAFGLAADRASPQDVDWLAQILKDAKEAFAAGDLASYFRMNSRFHESVKKVAANPYLTSAIEPLTGRIRWMVGHGHEYARTMAEHDALLEAIAGKDAEAARSLTRRHLEASLQHTLQLYTEHQSGELRAQSPRD